jgi:hypothetical protein
MQFNYTARNNTQEFNRKKDVELCEVKEGDITQSKRAIQAIQLLLTIAFYRTDNIILSPPHYHSHSRSPFHSLFVCVFCSALHSISTRVHLTQFNLILPYLTFIDRAFLGLVLTRIDEANYLDNYCNRYISYSVYRLLERSHGTGKAIVQTIIDNLDK